ncbi:MAG: ribonuclease J [Oscillospiraceae bacterium]|nr:ribonuclease J [Oscillospiraceae bacterium]
MIEVRAGAAKAPASPKRGAAQEEAKAKKSAGAEKTRGQSSQNRTRKQPSQPKGGVKPAEQNAPKQKNVQNAGKKSIFKSVLMQNAGSVKSQTAAAAASAAAPKGRSPQKKSNKPPIKITFIGGLNEIGKNITMYECGEDALLVDCGLAFPDDSMLGIDLVIPDFSYVEKNAHKIRGIVLTHGHEDHIGSLPYLLKKCNIPLYGTALTLGLVEGKLREHGILGQCKLTVVKPGQTVTLGCMSVEFIRVNHSIPDAVALAITSPAGVVVQTGDFKIDSTPVYGEIIDLGRFAELGKKGVLCLLSDSTNAERAGYTQSESKVGESFNTIFKSASASDKRIIIATFASNLQRIQQIIDCASNFGRKVAVSGRSMINAVNIAQELGYLEIPPSVLIDLSMINKYPKEQVVLVTTGTQGEPMSALTRMAFSDHRQVEVGKNDLIIISATPIPGNEKTVGNVINELIRHGCEVVYEKMYDVHVSGHACQEELKIILALTNPKHFIPVHGEQKHLKKHAALASMIGIPDERIMIADLGDSVEISENSIKRVDKVTAGRVLVDGLGVGDVGSVVLRDRKHLGEDGLLVVVLSLDAENGYIVSGPDIVSRGFVYVRDSEPLMEKAKSIVLGVIDECNNRGIKDRNAAKVRIREELSRFIYEGTRRSPMILPIIMDV